MVILFTIDSDKRRKAGVVKGEFLRRGAISASTMLLHRLILERFLSFETPSRDAKATLQEVLFVSRLTASR